MKLLLDPLDRWDDLDNATVAREVSILATAEPRDPEPKLLLRLDLPGGGKAIIEQPVGPFVQAIRGLAAKYDV